MEAEDVQVSGLLSNSGSRENCAPMVLIDQWFPITAEGKDASA